MQTHAGFEQQRVARAEAAGDQIARAARFDDRLPDAIRRLRRHEDLEAVLARVSGSRNRRADARDLAVREPVVLDGAEVDAGQRLKNAERFRTLHGDERVSRARVDGHGIARRLDLARDPRVVLPDVAGVDHEQEMIGREAIHEQVVDERAGRRHQAGVLRLTDGEPAGVVRRNALHGRQRVLAGDLDLAHVADVEEAGARPHGGVLGHDAAAGILDGHVPAAERNHFRAGSTVTSVERRLLERSFGGLFHVGCAQWSGTGNGTMRIRTRSRIDPLATRLQAERQGVEP